MEKGSRKALFIDGDWIIFASKDEHTGTLKFERRYNDPGMPIENNWTAKRWR